MFHPGGEFSVSAVFPLPFPRDFTATIAISDENSELRMSIQFSLRILIMFHPLNY